MTSDEEALRAVNRHFYGAIEEADVDAMRRVWSPEQVITCVHPRCQLLTGWDDVIESWRLLFEEISPWQISVEEQRLDVRGDLGCVICLERYQLDVVEDDDEPDLEQAVPDPVTGDRLAGADPGEGALAAPSGAGIPVEILGASAGGPATGPGPALLDGGAEGDDEDQEGDEVEDDGVRLVVATHIFFREDGQWRLAHRHASPYTEEPSVPDEILN